jgi:simple sugar transport system substrate-binding protein
VRRLLLLVALTVAGAALLLSAACSGDSSERDAAPVERADTVTDAQVQRPIERNVDIAVVTHGEASDPFWSVVRRGIEHAARETGATVSYSAPDVYEPVRMRELIEVAVANRPDGLVVSIPDPDALAPALAKASKAGIPIVAINSGRDFYRRVGALLYVGQPEYDAAFAAGRRMGHAGVRNAICVNHEPGVASLRERCRGFTEALATVGGAVRVVTVSVQEPAEASRRIGAAVSERGVDGLLTLGPGAATPALDALTTTRRLGKIAFGTFDLSPEVLRAVRAGRMEFAIDQQPFLQGYMPIVLLTQYELYGVLPARGAILPTGPSFVTAQEVARVARLSEAGIR